MYEQVVNVPRRSFGIQTFILKLEMTIFLDGMTLQEYPPNFNIPPSNFNRFLLQTPTNKKIIVGSKFYPQKS